MNLAAANTRLADARRPDRELAERIRERTMTIHVPRWEAPAGVTLRAQTCAFSGLILLERHQRNTNDKTFFLGHYPLITSEPYSSAGIGSQAIGLAYSPLVAPDWDVFLKQFRESMRSTWGSFTKQHEARFRGTFERYLDLNAHVWSDYVLWYQPTDELRGYQSLIKLRHNHLTYVEYKHVVQKLSQTYSVGVSLAIRYWKAGERYERKQIGIWP